MDLARPTSQVSPHNRRSGTVGAPDSIAMRTRADIQRAREQLADATSTSTSSSESSRPGVRTLEQRGFGARQG